MLSSSVPTSTASSPTGSIKKPRSVKTMPIETLGLPLDKLIKAPSMKKVLNSSELVLGISPIYANINSDKHQSYIVDGIDNLFKSDTNKLQIGVNIQLRGNGETCALLYGFNHLWLSNTSDEETNFGEWFNKMLTSNMLCIVSSQVRGWGKEKISGIMNLLNTKCEGELYSEDSPLDLTVPDSSSSGATLSKPAPKTVTQPHLTPASAALIDTIATLTANQKKMEAQMAAMAQLISKLMNANKSS